jgi:hypothetical protein
MNLKRTFQILDELAADFIQDDLNLMSRIQPSSKDHSIRYAVRAHPVWTILAVVLAFFLFTGVVYAIGRSLGYIPGFGLVDQGSPIRVLAEPAISIRDGISVAVVKAYLTSDRTRVEYQVFGVPHAAYPEGEAVTGCIKSAYLQLSDGTKVDVGGDMPPIAPEINQAVFVLPCIFNTLPGTVPVDWEIPVKFIPAPPNLTIVPVTEIVPSPTAVATNPGTQGDVRSNPLEITKVLDIGPTFVVMGELKYDVNEDSNFPKGSWWVDRGIRVKDANGVTVPYSFPNDIEIPTPSADGSGNPWGFQIEKTTAFPITISSKGTVIIPRGAEEQASFEFDAGNELSTGKEWKINKDFQLGGHSIHLDTVTYDLRGGYSFNFTSDPGAGNNRVQVDIEGYTPMCGGGGEGPIDPAITSFSRNFCIWDPATAPRGLLKIIITFQNLERQDKEFQMQWEPDQETYTESAPSTPSAGVCLDRSSLDQVPTLQNEVKGKVFLYQLMADKANWETVLTDLQGNEAIHLGIYSNWPTFLPDGERISYLDRTTLHFFDLNSSMDETRSNIAPGGYNLQWSPDGSQVAYVAGGNDIFVSNSDGSGVRQLTNNADYKTLAGWSPDGKALYITVPGLDGWVLKEMDLQSGRAKDLFTLQDASLKAPNVTISPDGQWFAYRDKNLNSLYLIRKDGTGLHKLVDQVSQGISTGYWSAGGKWIAVSLINSDEEKSKVYLIQPETCQSYLLPDLNGMLEGIQIK